MTVVSSMSPSPRITLADAAAACDHLGLGGPIRSLNQAREQRVFRVHNGGELVLLRLFIADTARHAQAVFEVELLRHLSATTDLRVPEPFGMSLVRDNLHAVAFRYLTGRAMGSRPTVSRVRQIGRFLAELHEHAAPCPAPAVATWTVDRVFDPLHDQLEWFTPEQRDVLRLAYHTLLQRLAPDTLPSTDVGIIHSDLHFANCVFLRDTIGVFDFAECGAGPLALDLAVPLVDMEWDFADRPELRDALLDGYATRRALPTSSLADAIALRYAETTTWYFTEWRSGERVRREAVARRSAATAIEHLARYLNR
jgi:Ser/Thr protein kinase RdoA (MazF antagonist)